MTSAPGHIKEDEMEAASPPSSPPRVSFSMAIAMKAGSTSPTKASFEDSFWEAEEGKKMLSFGEEEEEGQQQQQTSGQSTGEEQKILVPKEKMTGCAAVAKEGTTKPEKKTTASQAAVATEPSACTANQLAAEERSEDDALVTAAKRYAAQALLLIPTIIVLQLFLFLVVMVGELPVPEKEGAANNRRKRQPKKTTTKTQPKGTASTKKLAQRTPSWRLRIRPPPAVLDAKQAILQTLWPRVRRLNAMSPQQWQEIVAGVLVGEGNMDTANRAAAYLSRYLISGAAAQAFPLVTTMAIRRNRRAIGGNAIQNSTPSSASPATAEEGSNAPTLPIRRRSSLDLIDTGGTPRSTLSSPGAIAPTPNLIVPPPPATMTSVLRVRRSSKSAPRPAPTAQQQQRLRVRTSTLDLRDLRQRFRAGY